MTCMTCTTCTTCMTCTTFFYYFYPMPDLIHKTRVAFSVTNCICFDQRVLKIAETVSQLNCDITIIGRRLDDFRDSDSVPCKTRRFKMIFKKGFFTHSSIYVSSFFFCFTGPIFLLPMTLTPYCQTSWFQK
jgi:hypothetical protein